MLPLISQKHCSHCKKSEGSVVFHKGQHQCIGCHKQFRTKHSYLSDHKRELANAKRRGNPKEREYRLKKNHNISQEQYNTIFNNQSGCCAICKTHQSELKLILRVDHNHMTNEIRGLLCNDCNRGIGLLKDSDSILEQALDYINNSITGLMSKRNQ